VAAQIRASHEFGSNGWMLWNPRNRYDHAFELARLKSREHNGNAQDHPNARKATEDLD
jgi:hypothetical protein